MMKLVACHLPSDRAEKILSEDKFSHRLSALQNIKPKTCKRISPFVTEYHPSVPGYNDKVAPNRESTCA